MEPGVSSDLPAAFLPLVTIYRAEHVETPLADAFGVSDLCGLPARQLVLFRPRRLVVHELLIRVMSDISVPIGAVYADLGVNFRAIVATIFSEGIEHRLDEVAAFLETMRAEAAAVLDREIAAIFEDRPPASAPPPEPGWLAGLFRRGPPQPASPPREDIQTRALRHLDGWQARAAQSGDGWKSRPARPSAPWSQASSPDSTP